MNRQMLCLVLMRYISNRIESFELSMCHPTDDAIISVVKLAYV